MLNRILITGGSGRLGSMLIEQLAARCEALGVLSRSASKQLPLRQRHHGVHFFVGDINDRCAVTEALNAGRFDVVIHCAAMKDVAQCEANIDECLRVNVDGTRNMLELARSCGVRRFVYISTDMAVESSSVYGHSKGIADAMVINAARDGAFESCVVRLGNIVPREGSIFSLLSRKASELGYVPITHPSMSRFIMSSEQCAHYVADVALGRVEGGEIFLPECPSYDILAAAEAVAPSTEVRIVGERPGDVHSVTMIAQCEASRARSIDSGFVILPPWLTCKTDYGTAVWFELLTSANNPWRLTPQLLREYI